MKANLLEVSLREKIPLEQVIAVGDGANDLEMLSEASLNCIQCKPVPPWLQGVCPFKS